MEISEAGLKTLTAIALRWPVRDDDCTALEAAGLVERDGGDWMLTEAGEELLFSRTAGRGSLRSWP
jgi:hypothetical protein